MCKVRYVTGEYRRKSLTSLGWIILLYQRRSPIIFDGRGLYLHWRDTSLSGIVRRVGSIVAVFSSKTALETEHKCISLGICLRGNALGNRFDWAFLFEFCPLTQQYAAVRSMSARQNIYICLDAAPFSTFNNHLSTLFKKPFTSFIP